MYLLGKKVDLIEKEDILRLLENEISESKQLDYKRDLNIGRDNEKKEFLFDISAMYNTEGGCLIFGIEEKKDSNNQNTGIPNKITGIQIGNNDKLVQALEDIVKNNTEPSISNLHIKIIEIEEKNVLIIGMRKYITLPSMVTYNKTNKFYKRRNSGKYDVDVYELKNMFTINQEISDRILNFRNLRIKDVLSKKFLPNINDQTSVFVHIIPLSINDNNIIDFLAVQQNLLPHLKPMGSIGWNHLYNLEGFMTLNNPPVIQKTLSYTQIFRNGAIEAYSSEFFYPDNDELTFSPDYFIKEFFQTINSILKVHDTLNILPPFYISFSLHNILNKPISAIVSTARLAPVLEAAPAIKILESAKILFILMFFLVYFLPFFV